MIANKNTTIGRVGTMDVIKFGAPDGHRGVVYNPHAKFTSMNLRDLQLMTRPMLSVGKPG